MIYQDRVDRSYYIIRMYQDSERAPRRRVVKTGLTLAEAQAWCRDPETCEGMKMKELESDNFDEGPCERCEERDGATITACEERMCWGCSSLHECDVCDEAWEGEGGER